MAQLVIDRRIDSLATALARSFGKAVVEIGAGIALSVEFPKCWCMQVFANDDWLEVTYLWVHPGLRGGGIGHKLLDRLTAWADHNGVSLRLWAKPFQKEGGPGLPPNKLYSLAAWYATEFGFMPVVERRRHDEYHRVRMVR